MTLPASGTLRFSQILTEFGDVPPQKLSDYYGLLGTLPTSGPLSLSDFYGLSNAPVSNFAWTGRVKITPGKDGDRYGYQTGADLSGTARTAFGSFVSATNYNVTASATLWVNILSTEPYWAAIGYVGIIGTGVASANLPAQFDARNGVKIEYLVSGGSAPTASGELRSEIIQNTSKYGSDYTFQAFEPISGPLSNLATLAHLFKYCYDNNASIELITYAD